MIRDLIACPICGGWREHDLRTGDVGECDTCFDLSDAAEVEMCLEEQNG